MLHDDMLLNGFPFHFHHGVGVFPVRAHSRHASIATLQYYMDTHDLQETKRTLAELTGRELTKESKNQRR